MSMIILTSAILGVAVLMIAFAATTTNAVPVATTTNVTQSVIQCFKASNNNLILQDAAEMGRSVGNQEAVQQPFSGNHTLEMALNQALFDCFVKAKEAK